MWPVERECRLERCRNVNNPVLHSRGGVANHVVAVMNPDINCGQPYRVRSKSLLESFACYEELPRAGLDL